MTVRRMDDGVSCASHSFTFVNPSPSPPLSCAEASGDRFNARPQHPVRISPGLLFDEAIALLAPLPNPPHAPGCRYVQMDVDTLTKDIENFLR